MKPVTINQDIKALIPRDKQLSAAYLHGTLRALHSFLLRLVRTAAHGTRKLDTEDLLRVPIPIPTDSKLRTYLHNREICESALRGLTQTSAKLEHLFSVLLSRAFSGDLTAKWREEHMKELLAEMEEQAKALREAC